MPQEFLQRTTPSQRFIHGVAGIWVSFNIFFNYLMCVRTSAGSTANIPNKDLIDAYPPPERWCTACEKPKPALSHHCSVCGVCVLCMDHHCPWVNRCVGFYNYRYFYLFLFWLTIGCGWAVRFVSFHNLPLTCGQLLYGSPPFSIRSSGHCALFVHLHTHSTVLPSQR